MIDINIKGMRELRNKVNNMKNVINEGKQQFINQHIIREIKIDSMLIRNINRLVYQAYDPSTYERTRELLKAVTIKKTENGMMIYMDSTYLKRSSALGGFSWQRGYAPEAKGVDYSVLVEEGHTYQNVVGIEFEMEPRRFMGKTWEEVQREINPQRLIAPLMRMWDK